MSGVRACSAGSTASYISRSHHAGQCFGGGPHEEHPSRGASAIAVRSAGPLMRVAIVHYWLVGMRGGEKVLEALCDLFPQADIFTHVSLPEMCSHEIRPHKVNHTCIRRLPVRRRWMSTLLSSPARSSAVTSCRWAAQW